MEPGGFATGEEAAGKARIYMVRPSPARPPPQSLRCALLIDLLNLAMGRVKRTRSATSLLTTRAQDFGEHAREYVSSELGVRLLQALADPERRVRPLVGGGERADRLLQLLRRVAFKVRGRARARPFAARQERPRAPRDTHVCAPVWCARADLAAGERARA